jgi:hypothetical protein
MTQDEIIMAIQAGIIPIPDTQIMLERFAKLVAAKEREACAKVCEDKNTLLAWPTYAAAIRARGQA